MLPFHPIHRRRGPLTVLLFLLAAAAVLSSPATSVAKEWENRDQNVVLVIPDEPFPWEWLSFNPDWKKHDIVRGARRILDKRKDGKPVAGEGAILHLAIRKAPEEAPLTEVAETKEVRSFFLKRFNGTEEDVESEEFTVNSGTDKDGHPSVIVRASGESPNLRGNKQKCVGVMVVTVCKGKLYLLRMYAFPTEFDSEGLEVDLDMMEGGDYGLELIDTKAEKTAEAPKPPPDQGDGGGAPAVEEEEGAEEVIENRAQKWRIVKHKKLKRIEVTEEERKDDLELKFADSDRLGGYTVYLYAIPLGRIVDGQQLPAPNLVKWMTKDWWQIFTTNHPKGDLFTYKWPKKTSQPTFLTFPHMEDPKAKVAVITGNKKRPVEVDAGDMMKKLRCVEKPKKNKIGKKGKGSEALRGILSGNRPRYGVETVVRFAWRSPTHSYRLFVSVYGKAHLKWGDAIRSTLESMEFGVKFK